MRRTNQLMSRAYVHVSMYTLPQLVAPNSEGIVADMCLVKCHVITATDNVHNEIQIKFHFSKLLVEQSK